MEFPWISNVPGNHKQHSFLQKSNAASSSSFLLSSSSQSSSLSSSQAAAPPGFVRRPRADTMPAPSSPFVFSRDYTSSLDVPPQPTMRHRSGSATETRMRNGAGFSTTLFSSATLGSAASSPIDETGVASTLASLGLMEENEHNRYTPSETVPMLSVTTEPRSRGNSGGNLPTPTRGRAYTVGTRTPLEQPNVNRLLNFDPFSLDNETTGQQQRPRAISLGMADEPVPSSRLLYSATHNAAQRLQQQTQKQDSPLRTSASSGNLVGYMNYSDMPERTQDRSTQSSPSSSTAQVPSRALWLGNIDASLNVPELIRLFSCYGHVESARILSDKECAFVNFASVESAVAAKNDLETRLGSKVNGTTVRVGYGKADVNQAMANTSEAGPNAQGPTRALWIGNIPANMNPGILRAIFQPFGPIESVRVLSHKNCGFVNFEQQQDAVHARKALQNKEILGPGTGAVRIGFAKAPTASADESKVGEDKTNHFPAIAIHANPDTYQATQWATAMMMSSMMRTVAGDQQLSSASSSQSTSLYAAIAAERKFIMRQLGHEDTSPATEDRPPMAYCSAIPLIAELGSDRKLEPLRLREMRKKLDNGQQTLQDVEGMAAECMDEIVELCNDYIGNTVIQKLFECCSEATRLAMLEKIAPFLASIGVHKNGTWAAQKIIDSAGSPVLIRTISVHIAPYIPLLLLDQFGNYVVQCCLRKGPEYNQYILDAIADKCWEIGQGRFGARAVRAILESSSVTREQQTYVAAAIIQNTVLLTTNANGVLLLIWLLDTSNLPGRYSALCPRLLPYLGKLCTHKLGSMTVFKIINQTEEPDARRLLLNAIFNEPSLLDDVLRDQVHGLNLVQKIISIGNLERRDTIAQQIKDSLTNRLQVQHVQTYKKLLEELEQSDNDKDSQEDSTQEPNAKSTTKDDKNNNSNNDAVEEDVQWARNPQAVAMMANMYAAAMATAAASMQQPVSNGSPSMPDFSQFDHLIKSLLRNDNVQTNVKDTN